ncbi:hypothetical protein LBMAG27_17360 [Bacteroidota bacterium]|nr:hypothetical protein LBMAG27_17360 [Bacteroidota bacterium]
MFLLLISVNEIYAQKQTELADSAIFYSQINAIQNLNDSIPFNENSAIKSLAESINKLTDPRKKIYSFRLIAKIFAEKGYKNLSAEAFKKALSNTKPGVDSELRAEIKLEKARALFDFVSKDEIIIILNEALKEYPKYGGKTESSIYMYRGRAWYETGNYKNAMADYLKSELYFENNKIADNEYGHLLHFIGSIFKRQNDNQQALKYYSRIIDLGKLIHDRQLEAEGLYLCADIYYQLGDSAKDLDMSMRSLEIFSELQNYPMEGMMLMNIAHHYLAGHNFKKAKEYLDKSVEVNKLHNYNKNLATIYRYYGKYYSKTGNYKLAQEYLAKSFEEAEKSNTNRLLLLSDLYRTQASIHYDNNNFKAAFESLEDYQYYYDSLVNEENSNAIHDLEARYQNDKKEKEITLLNKDKALGNLKLNSARQKNIFLIVALIMVVSFFLFFFSRYRLINQQKIIIQKKAEELEKQKSIVVDQKNEILESIEYAKRIQATILPPPRVVKKYLEDSFILYLPKDIVAGDFYWMESPVIDNGLVLFAACDCTGHGVPGALVSVVCSNALNRTVKEFNVIQPALILDKVAELIVKDFSKDENENVQDGMDISLCALNIETGEMQWSGANNPIWILRDNNLIEIKGDKQPVGKYDTMHPFTNHKVPIQKGDTLYLFSDGYADQFGGQNNKKLTKAKFKELLLEIQNLNMLNQRNYLYEFHNKYKGSNEQVDDILIMGVKI